MSKTRTLLIYGITILILLLLFVLPALQKDTRHPIYYKSMINLRQIGWALWVYAEDHNDAFPDNIELLEEYIKDPYVFETRLKPIDFNGPSFIYVRGHSFKDAQAKEKYIIVYENPEYLSGYKLEQVNVLYLEGSGERLKKDKFLSELKKTYEHLGKPMPEIKFKEQVSVNGTK